VKYKNPITIIGAGAVGSSIALALFYKRVKIAGIYSLSGISAKKIAKIIGTIKNGRLDSLELTQGVVIVAVPDKQVSSVVNMLMLKQIPLRGCIFLHTSGALSSDALLPLKRKGASIASFHPIQTFPSSKTTSLKNIWAAIEGNPKAVLAAKQLAKILQMHTFTIPKEAKVLYHTAAVFASNYLVTLLSVVEQVADRIKIPHKNIWKIYQPLIEQTLRNVVSSSPANALTGPIARGDVETIEKHLQELSKKKLDHLVPLYSVLGLETARLARKKRQS
jgi:predicted short-subunit dehydrogenase-like oxidoreductase (DUF2520 family)